MSKKQLIEQQKALILSLLERAGGAVSLGDIGEALVVLGEMEILDPPMHHKSLQRRLRSLVEGGFVIMDGGRNTARYRVAKGHYSVNPYACEFEETVTAGLLLAEDRQGYGCSGDGEIDGNNGGRKTVNKASRESDVYPPATTANVSNVSNVHTIFSPAGIGALSYLDTPCYARKRCSYVFSLVNDYVPNHTQYVPDTVRHRLQTAGKRFNQQLAAGTYAKQISQRLLIDLSYHSSRLEGNTYSRLDTEKLIEQGLCADGKVQEETVMIMNHKEAIGFLIENAKDIDINSFTIRNIHALLSQDLLIDPKSRGNVRQVEVNIGQSAYVPLNNPHVLAEYLLLILLKAEKIDNPFEQSFFLLLHLSYLQAFEDVNKRTARLACNIPFIKANLCPLSFVDVPQQDYLNCLLYFYETQQLSPALELFEWAYLRSCEQYDAVTESLGEIDGYRIQHRADRKLALGHIIRQQLEHHESIQYLEQFCQQRAIPLADKFISMTLNDLSQLHEGAIVGLGITEKQFIAWKAVQTGVGE